MAKLSYHWREETGSRRCDILGQLSMIWVTEPIGFFLPTIASFPAFLTDAQWHTVGHCPSHQCDSVHIWHQQGGRHAWTMGPSKFVRVLFPFWYRKVRSNQSAVLTKIFKKLPFKQFLRICFQLSASAVQMCLLATLYAVWQTDSIRGVILFASFYPTNSIDKNRFSSYSSVVILSHLCQ